jgi:hypothetical protein
VERGVIVGGLLVSASFLLAVMLNRSAVEEAASLAPAPAATQALPDAGQLTPVEVMQLDQPGLDAVYAAAAPGPIPDGTYVATPFVPRPRASADVTAALIARLPDDASHLPVAQVRAVVVALWRKRVFDRSQHLVRAWLDGSELIYPGRVQCAPSLVDPDGTAILIDYTASEHLPGYREIPDAVTGRSGLRLREEMRALRPGLYLGRAYSGDTLVLNFVLYDDSIPRADGGEGDRMNDDCGAGGARAAHR